MSQCHAQANHRLYLARLLIAAWERELDAQRVPAWTLAQAFEPAVSDHLADAYGWFLLEVARPDDLPAVPPRRCNQLPPTAAGRERPPELREFELLEQQGWLAEVLQERRGAIAPQRAVTSLAGAAPPEPARAREWADALQALFDRMSESLEEY
jgi:hypothetical protein